eukprot:4405896-Amphidinium_carterae.1
MTLSVTTDGGRSATGASAVAKCLTQGGAKRPTNSVLNAKVCKPRGGGYTRHTQPHSGNKSDCQMLQTTRWKLHQGTNKPTTDNEGD